MISCSNSFASKNFAQSLKWAKSKTADLTKLIKIGDTFHSSGFITLDKTTNRTHKPGDDIFSTPSMIYCMSKTVLTKVNDKLPANNSSVTTGVICQHRAPMSLGDHYNITVRTTKVEPKNAEFEVNCLNDNNKLIGNATVKIGIVED